MFRIAIICGGPSLERGISLNSARSLLDHLSSHSIEVIPYYVDYHKNFYRLSPSQLYCNTPSDFDFKLSDTAALLSTYEFTTQLRDVDLVFPAIHGPYGEDGELQRLLEAHDIPFVGCSSHACQQMFYKHHANEILAANGLPTLSTLTLRKGGEYLADQIKTFFTAQNLNRAVVKPVAGGSSIGVFSVQTPSEALDRVLYLFDQNIDDTVLIEPFCVGSEFTVMVLQNADNQPVALMPTQIEISYENNQIFDYRRKYLPTANTFYHTPALFSDIILHDIRAQAEAILLVSMVGYLPTVQSISLI
jgi:D-alanine--D-alanine ligase